MLYFYYGEKLNHKTIGKYQSGFLQWKHLYIQILLIWKISFKMEDEQVKETIVGAKNFGFTIELQKWQKLWDRNYKLTMATAYKENLYKMFYRWHLPPARLAKMFNNLSAKCWKCNQTPGTYYHMWWTCMKARKYWTKIHTWLEKMIKQHRFEARNIFDRYYTRKL
uniref:Reverse transcriptase zinc-binding domain-containing protein n=1 Tax=Micrurus paraensis TaxID=1970185 RepID=A0A2D4JTW9_9SAUR